MIVVMESRGPVARQIGLRGGRPVLVGAPSCPGVTMCLSANTRICDQSVVQLTITEAVSDGDWD